MKKINTILLTVALVFTACNNEGSNTGTIPSAKVQEEPAPKVDIDKAMEGIPQFSTPEIQKDAEEWFSVVNESMKEIQQKATEASGDQETIQQIAMEMEEKLKPWNEKVTALLAKMTPEDKQKFEAYGAKFANSIVSQGQE